MNELSDKGISKLGYILAVQAQIDGMKIENAVRLSDGLAPAWGMEQFEDKATELHNLAIQ